MLDSLAESPGFMCWLAATTFAQRKYFGAVQPCVVRRKSAACVSTWFRLPEKAQMPTGNVKWFNPTKGYGFIQPQGGGQDVFVHISAVERAGLTTLNEGQQVEFEIVNNRGKSSAENLKVK